jgi:peptidoglycan/xylan/chitin deacetylase (PgdA/CDA1 family)
MSTLTSVSIERRRLLSAAAGMAAAGLLAACDGKRPTATATTPLPVPKRSAPVALPLPLLPGEVTHGPRTGTEIALTFHGAGDPALDRRLLKELESAGAQVTVMAIGSWLDADPSMARRVLDGGHELGNHTQNHGDIGSMSASAAYAEITQCAERLRRLTGSIGAWFRPSQTQHASAMIQAQSRKAGYRACLSYDLDSLDFKDPGSSAITRNVLNGIRPGSVVSMHFGHEGTVAAMPAILDGLRSRGLKPVTVSRLLGS